MTDPKELPVFPFASAGAAGGPGQIEEKQCILAVDDAPENIEIIRFFELGPL